MPLNYYFLRLAAKIARLVPLPLGYFLAGCAGTAVFFLSPGHRRIIDDNLRHIPGVGPDRGKRRRLVRNVLKTMAGNYVDLTRLTDFKLEDLKGKVRVEGWQNLIDAVTSGRGTVAISAHLGNFDAGVHFVALHGIEMCILVEAFDSSPFLRNIAQLRGGGRCRLLPVTARAMREGLQILRQGGTVIVLSDRDVQGNGLKTKFFGAETTLPTGAVSMALRTGASILPVFCAREPGGRSVLYIEPALEPVNTGNRDDSLRANLEMVVAVMERYIRRHPDQWVVLEPVWRNAP